MRKFSVVAAVALSVLSGPVAAGGEIGEVKAVVQKATASGKVGDRTLAVGASVFVGDKVSTDANGAAQLLFSDGTRTVIGPNSSLVLDEFVFNSGGQKNRFAVRAQRGAFRFMSGNSPKDAYLIQTPAASIGMRGTVFDFNVSETELDLLLLERGPPDGGATVCPAGVPCSRVDEVCELVNAERGRGVEPVDDEGARAETVAERFPFVTMNAELQDGFRIEGEEGKACLAEFAPIQQEGVGVGGTAPGPIAGPGIPPAALPVAGLAALGLGAGLLFGGKGGGTTTTTSTTTTTTTATGTGQ